MPVGTRAAGTSGAGAGEAGLGGGEAAVLVTGGSTLGPDTDPDTTSFGRLAWLGWLA